MHSHNLFDYMTASRCNMLWMRNSETVISNKHHWISDQSTQLTIRMHTSTLLANQRKSRPTSHESSSSNDPSNQLLTINRPIQNYNLEYKHNTVMNSRLLVLGHAFRDPHQVPDFLLPQSHVRKENSIMELHL